MIPEPVLRMFRHPDSNKVLSVVSPDGFPHSIVLGGLIVDDEDRLYVGEAYMYRTAQYLEECPNAEFLAWKGKDGYSLKAVAVGRLTEGPEFERMREMLERKNMRAVAVWVFKSVEVWDESASDTSGERILRWTSPARGRLSASSCFSPFSRRSQDWSSIPAGACSRGCFSS